MSQATESDELPSTETVDKTRRLILLGPQPQHATLQAAMKRLGCDAPVAVVTAGWQEDESADDELMSILPSGSINLKLFQRSEELFENDDQLIRVLRQRQDDLRVLRDAYLLRLDHCLSVIRGLGDFQTQVHLDINPEVDAAFEALRQLDRQYLIRTTQICDQYDCQLDINKRPNVSQHREELQTTIGRCSAIVISGGHVGIILNRLRLFGILESNSLPIVAWSGGAMSLADQIILFHDHPPQGKGNPEVLRAGMGLFHEIIPLPDASHRLHLDDSDRVGLIAERFRNYACIELSESTLLERRDGHWKHNNCSRLMLNGSLEALAS